MTVLVVIVVVVVVVVVAVVVVVDVVLAGEKSCSSGSGFIATSVLTARESFSTSHIQNLRAITFFTRLSTVATTRGIGGWVTYCCTSQTVRTNFYIPCKIYLPASEVEILLSNSESESSNSELSLVDKTIKDE